MNFYKFVISRLNQAFDDIADLRRAIMRVPSLRTAGEPVDDSHSSQLLHHLAIPSTATTQFGLVADYVPYSQSYRVFTETSDVILCNRLNFGSVSPIGVTDADTLQPGAVVVIMRHPQQSHGVILGSVPPATADARLGLSDAFGQDTNVGIQIEAGYQAPFKVTGNNVNGGIIDWSSGNPIDSLENNEFCRVAETGLMLSLDSFMGQLRVDETCGLWVFYWDQLLRLAGYNLEQLTAGSLLQAFDDEGTWYCYDGFTPYLQEHAGRLTNGIAFTDIDAKTSQLKKPWLAGKEPVEEDQIPFHRFVSYRGFIANGDKQFVCAPHPSLSINTLSDTNQLIGLFDRSILPSGHFLLRTATGLVVGKHAVIPVPKRVKDITDPTGRTAATDPAATPSDASLPPNAADQNKSAANLASHLHDWHAHLFNMSANRGFVAHQRDFEYPEEKDYEHVKSTTAADAVEQLAGGKWVADVPTPVEVTTGPDGSTTRVYPGNASLTINDIGDIILENASGCRIELSGGNIRLSAPGDVLVDAGRNGMLWSGNDTIIKSKNATDVTSTDGSLRLKSEKHMQFIGANGGGNHGVMIESRGSGSVYNFDSPGDQMLVSGIVLSSRSAPIVNWSSDVYLRTVNGGTVTLDADEGRGSIVSHASKVTRYIASAAFDYFGTQGNIQGTNLHSQYLNLLSGGVVFGGDAFIDGQVIARQDYKSLEGHFSSTQASSNPSVSTLEGNLLEASRTAIDQLRDRQQDENQAGTANYALDLDTKWYADGKAGNEDIVQNGAASLRTASEYGTTDYYVTSPSWADAATLSNVSTGVWTENAVQFANTETLPFPGERGKDSGSLLTSASDGRLINEDGSSVDRSVLASADELPAMEEKKLASDYPTLN